MVCRALLIGAWLAMLGLAPSGLAVGVAGNRPAMEWRQFRHGPERTGFATAGTLIGTQTARALQIRWTAPAPAQANLNSSPAFVDRHVFVADGLGRLLAYRDDGRLEWSAVLGAPTDSSPAVVGGRVFVGACDTLFAFSQADGSPLWSREFTVAAPHACGMSSPAVVGGVVYVGSQGDGALHAVDAATGTELWRSTPVAARSSVAVAGGMALVGSNDHHIYAFPTACATPCAPRWSRDLGGVVEATPAVAGGLVYTHSWSSPLVALRLSDGGHVWAGTGNGGRVSSPAVAQGVVYTANGALIAYDAATGRRLWKAPLAGGFASPAVANGVVYQSYGDAVRAFDAATGSVLRSIQSIGGGTWSSAAVGTHAVYATAQDGRLYAIGLR